MLGGVVSRTAELGVIADVLTSAGEKPSGLVIEGDAGIGKTVLWAAALDKARELGFRVLTARAGEAESALGYTAVADLLGDIEPPTLAELPGLQRAAVDQVLVRNSGGDCVPDPRVVATAFLTVLDRLVADSPVLVAVDDVHWLDPLSKAVVAFVIRRLRGRVVLLITERTPGRASTAASLLRDAPLNKAVLRVGPLRLGALHTLVSQELGRSLPHPTMVRIAELSGGNPFYAMELARVVDVSGSTAEPLLPGTLVELTRSQIGQLGAEIRDVLLAASCAAEPTIDHVAHATGIGFDRTVDLLEEAESRGILEIDGNRVRFSHPLLARGVYAAAAPGCRRKMHRAMAEVEEMPEHRARHQALAAVSADGATLLALDSAADAALARHAPAAAAELVDLAIKRGGDTPVRRLSSASYHMRAGDNHRARILVEQALPQLPAGKLRATAVNLLAEIRMFHNDFVHAIELLETVLEEAETDPAVLVRSWLLMSLAQLDSGNHDASLDAARQARAASERQDSAALTSQALSMWVTAKCVCGQGVDTASLQRALDLEEIDDETPIPFRASVVNALMSAWTGQLDDARARMDAVRCQVAERGDQCHLLFIDLHSALIDTWRADFAAASACARDALERAEPLGCDHLLVLARTVRAVVAAHTGDEEDARANARAAIEQAHACGSPRLADRPTMALGMLEVSLGNYTEALDTLQPLIQRFDATQSTEINTAEYLPDAVESMIAVGSLDFCEPMIQALERNGRGLDRSWMLAAGARCRAMLLGGLGDVAAAERMAHRALREHERLCMPLERARTQLLLGQVQRRQRQKEAATTTLRDALVAFEGMGARLWADRVRAELARTNVCPSRDSCLTPSEQRVAELAASGMTNRDVAAALFISPKTVEANLARIYRKLGIHSRAELGRVVGAQEEAKLSIADVVS